MSCQCDQEQYRPLLAGLMGNVGVPANASFYIGFELERDWWSTSNDKEYLEHAVAGCLWETDGFEDVNATINPALIGHPYITVWGVVGGGFARREDLINLIRGVMYECAPELRITRQDTLAVSADGSWGQQPTPGGQQPVPGSPPGSGQGGCPAGTTWYESWWSKGCVPIPNPNQDPKADKCDWDKMSLTEYAACNLGITRSGAATVGVMLALVGVIVVVKIAK